MGIRKLTLADYGTVADALHQKKEAVIDLKAITNNSLNIQSGDRVQLCREGGSSSFRVRVTETTTTAMRCVPV